jgi:hypothetical protein
MLQTQDLLKDRPHYVEGSVRVAAVAEAAVVAILIAPLEALAEVVAILVETDVVPVIAVGSVAVGVGVSIFESPMILSIRLPRANPFFITESDGLSKEIGAILARLVVSTGVIVPVEGRRVKERPRVLETQAVLPQVLVVALLKPQLGQSALPLEAQLPLLGEPLLLLQLPLILIGALFVTTPLFELALLRSPLPILLLTTGLFNRALLRRSLSLLLHPALLLLTLLLDLALLRRSLLLPLLLAPELFLSPRLCGLAPLLIELALPVVRGRVLPLGRLALRGRACVVLFLLRLARLLLPGLLLSLPLSLLLSLLLVLLSILCSARLRGILRLGVGGRACR